MLEVLSLAVKQLCSEDVSLLCDEELHEDLIALRKQIDLLAATEARMLDQWDQRKCWAEDGSKSAGHRLSRETGSSIGGCKRLMRRAERLRSMPLVAAAFDRGDLSADRVDLLCALNEPEVAELFARDEAVLVEHMKALTWPDAQRLCRYWRLLADQERTERKSERLIEQRSMHASRTLDDAVDIRALLDPVNGEIFLNALELIEKELFESDWAEARERFGDTATVSDLKRTPSQRRADALVEMAIRSATAPKDGKRPKYLLTVMHGEKSFAGVCETASGTVLAPGQVVPFLSDADVERIVFDGPKRVIEVGQARSFRGALERAIKVRDRHCQHPSVCDTPAYRCQCDHIDPWSNGGGTIECNGQCLCAFHNRLKGADPPEPEWDGDPPP